MIYVTPRFAQQSRPNRIDKFLDNNSQSIKIENRHKKRLKPLKVSKDETRGNLIRLQLAVLISIRL